MKTLFSLILLFCSTSIFATDLVVESFGLAPAYSDIQSAINAASNGDRILIKNRPGGIPWIQNLTISKNVQLLSYENDSMFYYQGDITIAVDTATDIAIIGLYNYNGDILTSGGGNTGYKTCNLALLDSYINGGVDVDDPEIILECASNEIEGNVRFSHGNLIGNIINGDANFIGDAYSTYSTEKVRIIGNQFARRIIVQDANYNFEIKNNIIISFFSMSIERTGIYQNVIYNNSFQGSLSASFLIGGSGISMLSIETIAGSGQSTTEIMNNTFKGDVSYYNNRYKYLYGIGWVNSNSNSTVHAYFNHFSFTHYSGSNYTRNINGTLTSAFSNLNSTITNNNTTVVDGGNPAAPFYDLDLSPNDAGPYGGSYTLDNFFPLRQGGARVYMVDYPFNVRQGSTLNIEASSFDR